MSIVYVEPLARRADIRDVWALIQQAGLNPNRDVSRAELAGRRATLEVPEHAVRRVISAIDGMRFGNGTVRAWGELAASKGAAEDHFARLARLLTLEADAQAEASREEASRLSDAEAERLGLRLVRLAVMDVEVGLAGRYLVQLARTPRAPLPPSRLSSGSPVMLSAQGQSGGPAWRGVVYERTSSRIGVALAQSPDELDDYDTWRIDLADDQVGIERQRQALARAQSARGNRTAELRDALLGERPPADAPQRKRAREDDWVPASRLNESQQAAVDWAIDAPDVALIHGPPGTGKTTTVVQLIARAVSREQRVLACAPSNLAVDNMLERLIALGVRAVRLGHPARVLPVLRDHTLEVLVDRHHDVRTARGLVRDAMQLFRQAGKDRRARWQPGERRELRQEARALLADARRLEDLAVAQILDTAPVLCATTTGLDDGLLGARQFDLTVIDEACQSTEPGCWPAILRGSRLVLAGDHCQLPPVIKSAPAAAEGLGRSLFERLIDQHPQVARQLLVQYRMNQQIMEFSSNEFYESNLIADPSVAEHRLVDLPGITATPLTERPMELVDTAGAGYDEAQEHEGQSRMNPQEARWVATQVRALLEAGVSPQQIGVITPYAAQTRLLVDLLEGIDMEIDTVDGFQGREKEAIIISLVRSNAEGEIGFLGDVRRMNVAMTRARRKLLMIGDGATLAAHPFYSRLWEYCETAGAYRSIWEDMV